jgi:hypothetical protein
LKKEKEEQELTLARESGESTTLGFKVSIEKEAKRRADKAERIGIATRR